MLLLHEFRHELRVQKWLSEFLGHRDHLVLGCRVHLYQMLQLSSQLGVQVHVLLRNRSNPSAGEYCRREG